VYNSALHGADHLGGKKLGPYEIAASLTTGIDLALNSAEELSQKAPREK
jgi:hypothetical protein